MKTHLILKIMIVTCMAALSTGCRGKIDAGDAENGQAFLNEGNGDEDAVNTLQSGSKYRITGPMDDLRDAVVEILGENYWPDTLLSAEELVERTGISENMYQDFLAEYQRTEAGIDMMILVEAKEDEIENVEEYLNEYREVLLNIYEQQFQNEAKVYASRIETIDNYVCYVQLGADISVFNDEEFDEMVAFCQQENERALDIIEKRILSE